MPKAVGAYSRLALPRLWMVVGAVGLVWVIPHGLGLLDPDGSYTVVVAAAVAVVATVVGIRMWQPRPRWPWLTVLGAFVLFLFANALRLAFDTLGNLGASRSLLPDLFALPGYVVLAIGVAGIAGIGRRDQNDIDSVLDAVIASLAVLALAWSFLVVPFLSKGEVGLGVEILLAAYPVASVFVLAMGARLMFGNSRATVPAMLLSLTAIAAMLVGDVAYMLVDGNLFDLPAHIVDFPYTVAFLAYATAVLHPTVAQVSERRPTDDAAPSRGRLVSVGIALSIPTIILFTGVGDMSTGDRAALGVIVTLLVVVAVLRMGRALRQHASSEERLAYQATHDTLTGLPNRPFISEQLARTFTAQRAVNGSVSLLHVNIDRFGLVNDTMGHGVGDDLLCRVGERLAQNVRAQDVVGRIGGDEFAVVTAGLESEAQAVDFGERTRILFKAPFVLDGAEIPLTVSVGVAYRNARDGDAAGILRDADTAVNHAKGNRGDVAVVFDDSMRDEVAERLQLERELRHALERGQLSLHYQPRIRLSDRRAVGLEALLRWSHPELGMVPPDRFIPIAEDTGMISELGAWVIGEACQQIARLREEMVAPDLVVSVNVSARQLRTESLPDVTAQALLAHGVPPSVLCLELTESVLMENLQQVSGQLTRLRDYGVKISFDDFGTGYSSLAYLSNLSVDELKIDRSFVAALDEDPHAADVIQAVVFLASSLGITIVAEGTETEEQVARLAELGCDEAQGYVFSRPVPADELPSALQRFGIRPRPHLRALPGLADGGRRSTA